ncbi:MAG TPA: hypothetical protein VM262_16165 [Acidimicrobiales bacterium]|nr:hypothetical protein [Acidimicrobiales bacterium]
MAPRWESSPAATSGMATPTRPPQLIHMAAATRATALGPSVKASVTPGDIGT